MSVIACHHVSSPLILQESVDTPGHCLLMLICQKLVLYIKDLLCFLFQESADSTTFTTTLSMLNNVSWFLRLQKEYPPTNKQLLSEALCF